MTEISYLTKREESEIKEMSEGMNVTYPNWYPCFLLKHTVLECLH